MAVIKCGECKGNVSASAKACPHCGAKPRKFKRNPWSAKQKLHYLSLLTTQRLLPTSSTS